jgi:hypothetical protein
MSSDWLRSGSSGMGLACHSGPDGMHRKSVSRLSRCIRMYDIYFYAIHIRIYTVRMGTLLVAQTRDKQSEAPLPPPSVS